MNYWKQLNHVTKYFRDEEDPNAKLPQNFMTAFLEVRLTLYLSEDQPSLHARDKLGMVGARFYH